MARLASRYPLRLIAGGLAPLVIAGVIQVVYGLVSQRQAALAGLEAKASAVTSLLVGVAGPSLAVDDPADVAEGLAYIANDPDFGFALAIAADGKEVAFRGPPDERATRIAAATITQGPLVTRVGDMMVASYPVVTGTRTIGEIVVGLRTAGVEGHAMRLAALATMISAIGAFLAVLVVLRLVRRITQRNHAMRALLENVEQGFLNMRPDGALAVERSAMAARLIGKFQPNQLLWQALAPIDPSAATWLELGWAGVREGFLPLELSLDQLPKRLVVGDRVYRIEYRPSVENDVIGDTLVVITDATAEIARARAEAAERELLRVIEHISNDRSGFAEFVEETDRLLDQLVAAADGRASPELLRNLHTLKGNSGLYGLSSLAERCHQLEDQLAMSSDVDTEGVRALARSWTELKAKLAGVFGANLLRSGADVRPEDLTELHDAIARGASLVTIKQLVDSWKLERTRPRLERFADQARSLAVRIGKPGLEVAVDDHGIRLDGPKLRGFWNAFSHVVRNAVDHGIESSERRQAAGKPEHGRIEIETRRDGTHVVIELRDDGGGIDWDAVRARARAANLPAATHEDLVAALFSDGITTKDEVSEVSGRGVGLAALRAACAGLQGTIEVLSERGKGSTFRFSFSLWRRERISMLLPHYGGDSVAMR